MRYYMRLLFCIFLTVFLIACGGGDTTALPSPQANPDPITAIVNFEGITLNPSAVELNEGSGSVNVDVTIFFSNVLDNIPMMRVTYNNVVRDYPISEILPGRYGATIGSFQMDTTTLASYNIQ
ncbi:hypothetical protein JZU71_01210, partial [bacterium]|nr:hypothetical protein [bacterium]